MQMPDSITDTIRTCKRGFGMSETSATASARQSQADKNSVVVFFFGRCLHVTAVEHGDMLEF